MWSTKVNQFANYSFKCASCASNRGSPRTSRSNCGLYHVFLTLMIKWYIPLACLHPWWHYTTLLDTAVKVTKWGFWVKKNSQRDLHSILSHRIYFDLSCKNSNFILHDLIHDPRSDLWSGPWSDSWSSLRSDPWSNPVQSSPIQILSAPQSQGHFRSFWDILEVPKGHF